MRLLLVTVLLLGLAAACSKDKPKLLKPDQVTPAELAALIPADMLPAGFSASPMPTSGAGPGTLPDVPYHVSAYSRGGVQIIFFVLADGARNLGKDQVADICAGWKKETGSNVCPVKREQAAKVGDLAAAFSSSDSQARERFRTDRFVRAGISVSATVNGIGDAPDADVPGILRTIDQRIQALAAAKLDKR